MFRVRLVNSIKKKNATNDRVTNSDFSNARFSLRIMFEKKQVHSFLLM